MSTSAPNAPCNFFLSRTGTDAAWAEWIAWTLEQEGYTTYLQDWDFRPGRSFVRDMQEGATNCERTIAVLSPAYFDSAFSAAEWEAALTKDPTGANRRLITVRVQACDPPGLLARYPYIDLVGLDEDAARTALLDGVGEGRRKPDVAPNFPGHHGPSAFPGPSHEHVAPEDTCDAIARVESLLPQRAGHSGATLYVAVAGIPRVVLVRPAVLGSEGFMQTVTRRAMDVEPPLLDMQDTSRFVANGQLVIEQRDRGITLDPSASTVLVRLPAHERQQGSSMLTSVIEEDVQKKIECALSFVAQSIDALDTAHKVHHVVPIVAITGANYTGWRTRAERDANPNMMTLNMMGTERAVVRLDPPAITRQVLAAERLEVAADLTALLRDRVRKQS